MIATIYKITNSINNKIYVGQTWKTAQERFNRHCAEARWKTTKRMPIVFAIKKYGKENFQIHILETISDQTQNYVDEREIFWVKQLNTFSPNGYNLKAGQANGLMSEETKRKISDSNKEKTHTEETKRRLRESHLGHKATEESKRKLSIFNTGKKLTEDHKNKIRQSNLGQVRTEETKENMRRKKLKYIYKFKNPDGAIVETNNIEKLAKEKGLNSGHLYSVVYGTVSQHKGWRFVSRDKIKFEAKQGYMIENS